MQELIELVKLMYFPLILLFLYDYYKSNKLTPKMDYITYNAIVIALSIIVAKITNTGSCTYGTDLNCIYGFSGWFYAPNELSGLLIVLLAICLYNYTIKNSVLNLIGVLSIIFAMNYIGTKGAIFGLVLILILFGLHYLLKAIVDKDKEYISYCVLMALLFATIVFNLPNNPVCLNNEELFNNYGVVCWGKDTEIYEVEEKEEENKEQENAGQENTGQENTGQENTQPSIPQDAPSAPSTPILPSLKENEEALLNGRDKFLVMYKNLDIDFIQKLFGIGRVNTRVDGKIIERDFHDLYYGYGILGLIAILLLPIVIVVKSIIKRIKNFKNMLDIDNALIASLIVLLGLSGIAGHIIFAPSITIFISYIIVYYLTSRNKNEN